MKLDWHPLPTEANLVGPDGPLALHVDELYGATQGHYTFILSYIEGYGWSVSYNNWRLSQQLRRTVTKRLGTFKTKGEALDVIQRKAERLLAN